MPLKDDKLQFNLPMTQSQYAWVKKQAAKRGQDMTELIRSLIDSAMASFPDDMPERGTYERKSTEPLLIDLGDYQKGLSLILETESIQNPDSTEQRQIVRKQLIIKPAQFTE